MKWVNEKPIQKLGFWKKPFCSVASLWERKKKRKVIIQVFVLVKTLMLLHQKLWSHPQLHKVRTPSKKDTEDSNFNSYSKYPLALYLWSEKQQNSYHFRHTVSNGFSSLACSALKKIFSLNFQITHYIYNKIMYKTSFKVKKLITRLIVIYLLYS